MSVPRNEDSSSQNHLHCPVRTAMRGVLLGGVGAFRSLRLVSATGTVLTNPPVWMGGPRLW